MAISFKGAHFPKEIILTGVRCYVAYPLSYRHVEEKITIDGSAANEAAIKSYNEAHGTAIVIRQVKYLNNIVEQDHRAVKRMTRPMLGFKSFAAAQATLVGIELMHMIKKRQMVSEAGDEASLRPNSSTLSPPNPRTTSGFSPHIGYMSEIATKPGNVVLGFHNASRRCSLHSIYTLPWYHAPQFARLGHGLTRRAYCIFLSCHGQCENAPPRRGVAGGCLCPSSHCRSRPIGPLWCSCAPSPLGLH